ncbi:hypothetical protein PHJA_002544400 [Phtheirospermum japonicum]|uniref:Uncharacterized protein n=1 Tax=Phtheirospermum japonicum TaxID=374723 RepID=A0A830D670_9LAMI|nr:hypothetical protein PHJA_002544400 [Phtheirospermum japonicum]
MKISVKLQDHHKQTHSHEDKHHRLQPPPLLVRAKIPVTIFNLPFLSHFSTTTTHPSDLSLSLSTNLPSFPSLKLSYATSAAAAAPPLSLTLKSGTGLFGSPNNSPLVISAHFSFNPSNPNHPNPTFSLFFKPQLGSFSLRKSTFSHSDPTTGSDSDSNSNSNSFGFVPVESPAIVKDLSVVETENVRGNSILKGIQLAARTQMPVSKRVGLDFRWWVNFAEDNQMPVLRINKIGVRRVYDDVLVGEDEKNKKKSSDQGEVEVLKGMCFWMKKELDGLTRVNREMKCELEEMKAGHSARINVERPNNSGGGFEKWRSNKRKGEEIINGKKEEKKSGVSSVAAVDVENELERAIKAAAASSSS